MGDPSELQEKLAVYCPEIRVISNGKCNECLNLMKGNLHSESLYIFLGLVAVHHAISCPFCAACFNGFIVLNRENHTQEQMDGIKKDLLLPLVWHLKKDHSGFRVASHEFSINPLIQGETECACAKRDRIIQSRNTSRSVAGCEAPCAALEYEFSQLTVIIEEK